MDFRLGPLNPLKGIVKGIAGTVGHAVGKAAGFVGGHAGGGHGGEAAPADDSMSPDNSDAMIVASNNSKQVALAQVLSQEFTLQQASMDREMQQSANLELGLEKLDTKLEVSKMEFVQAMTAEENRHTERMASAGIPEPSFD